MINYKVTLSFDGYYFSGSQKQLNQNTIEDTLLSVLNKIFKDVDSLSLSGRTDSKVHALEQVFNFKSSYCIPESSVLKILNNSFDRIKILSVVTVDISFDSRKSALAREYEYYFTDEELPLYLTNYVTKINSNINESIILQFISLIKGVYNFSNFCKSGSSEKTYIREIFDSSFNVFKYKVLTDSNKTIKIYRLKIIGNAFLYRMVRNLIGCLFFILDNKITLNELKASLKNTNNKLKYKPALPNGLYLKKILY